MSTLPKLPKLPVPAITPDMERFMRACPIATSKVTLPDGRVGRKLRYVASEPSPGLGLTAKRCQLFGFTEAIFDESSRVRIHYLTDLGRETMENLGANRAGVTAEALAERNRTMLMIDRVMSTFVSIAKRGNAETRDRAVLALNTAMMHVQSAILCGLPESRRHIEEIFEAYEKGEKYGADPG